MGILDSNRCACDCCGPQKVSVNPEDRELIQHALRALHKLNIYISNSEKWRKERLEHKSLVSRLQNEVATLGGNVVDAMKPDPLTLDLKREIEDIKNRNQSLEMTISGLGGALKAAEEAVTCRKAKKLCAKLRQQSEQCAKQEVEIEALRKRVRELEDAEDLVGDVRCKDLNNLRNKLRELLREKKQGVKIDQALSTHNKSTIAKIATVTTGLSDCEVELNRLREVLKELQLQLSTKDDIIKQLTERNAFMEKQLNEKLREATKKDEDIERLQNLLKQRCNLATDMRSKLKTSEIEKCRAKIAELEKALSETRPIPCGRDKSIDAMNDGLSKDLLDQINKLQALVSDRNDQIKRLLFDNKNSKKALTEKGNICSTKLKFQETKLEKMKTELHDKLKQLADLEAKLKAAQEAPLCNYESKFREAVDEISTLEGELSDAEERINVLLKQQRCRDNYCDDRIAVLHKEFAEAKTKIKLLVEEQKNYDWKVTALQKKCIEAERQMSDKCHREEKLNFERNDADTIVSDLKAKLKAAEDNAKAVKTKSSAMKIDVAEKLRTVLDKMNDCETKFAAMQSQLADAERTVSELENKLIAEQFKSNVDIVAMHAKLRETEVDLKEEKAKTSALESKVKDLLSGARDVEEQLKDVICEKIELQKKCEEGKKIMKLDKANTEDLQNKLKEADDSLKAEMAKSTAIEMEAGDRLDVAKRRVMECECKCVSLQEDLSAAEVEICDLKNKLETERVVTADFEVKLKKATDNLKAEKAKSVEVKNRLGEIAENCESQFIDMQGKLAESDTNASHLKKKLKSEQEGRVATIAAIQATLDRAKEKLEAEKVKSTALKDEVRNALPQIKNLERELKHAIEKTIVLESKLNNVEEKLNTEREQAANFQNKVKELENKYRAAKEEVKIAQAAIKDLQDKGAGDGSKLVQLEQKLKRAEDGVKFLKAELDLKKVSIDFKATQAKQPTVESGQTPMVIKKFSISTEANKASTTDTGQAPEETNKISKAIQAKKVRSKDSGQIMESVEKADKAIEAKQIARTEYTQTQKEVEQVSEGIEVKTADKTRNKTVSKGVESSQVHTKDSGQIPKEIEQVVKTTETKKADATDYTQTWNWAGKVSKGIGVEKKDTVESGHMPLEHDQASKATQSKKPDTIDSGQIPKHVEKMSWGIDSKKPDTINTGQIPKHVEKMSQGIDPKKPDTIDSGQMPRHVEKMSKGINPMSQDTIYSGQILKHVEKMSQGVDPRKPDTTNSGQITKHVETMSQGIDPRQPDTTNSGQIPEHVEKMSQGIDPRQPDTRNSTQAIKPVTVDGGQIPDKIEIASKGNEIKNTNGSDSIPTLKVRASKATQAKKIDTTESRQTSREVETASKGIEVKNATGTESIQTPTKDMFSKATQEGNALKSIQAENIDKRASGQITDKAEIASKGRAKPSDILAGITKSDKAGQKKVTSTPAKASPSQILKKRSTEDQSEEKNLARMSETESKEKTSIASFGEQYPKAWTKKFKEQQDAMKALEAENSQLREALTRYSGGPFDSDVWLRNLTLTELAELHERICTITREIIAQDEPIDDREFERVFLSGDTKPICRSGFDCNFSTDYFICQKSADQLDSKIAALQREILERQLETELKMAELKRAMWVESARIFEIKNDMHNQIRS